MGTADKIRELIEQTATIKANFHLENSLSFSSYDWRKREKKINYMQVEKINDDPEFMRWRDELVLSLAQLKKDDYIDEVIKLLKKFDGLTDKTTVKIDTLAGIKILELNIGTDGKVATAKVNMGCPVLEAADIPMDISAFRRKSY